MIFLEASLIAIIIVLFVNTSISDIKNGIISNKSIIAALCCGMIFVVWYYGVFAKDCIYAYIVNVVIGVVISFLLYAFGIWGAGDSKLLITTILLYPARLYCIGNRSVASAFLLIAIVFIVAFIFIVGDTLYLGIQQKNLFKLQKPSIDWKAIIKGFLFFFFLLSIANRIIVVLLPQSLVQDEILLTAIHFMLILVGMKLEEKANWLIVFILGAIWALLSVYSFLATSHFGFFNINWNAYFVIVLLMIFRLIADKYNYKTVQVSELRPGMILARGSILGFVNSRVAGLPQFSTEDLRSRLNQAEVDSINRWAKSKYGQDEITVVRKIPFALFISIGTLIFTIVEVLAT
jgi:Flp pilus assembly protein protease CpaA